MALAASEERDNTFCSFIISKRKRNTVDIGTVRNVPSKLECPTTT